MEHIHQLFLKVARNYTLPHYDFEPPLKDTVFDFATTVGDKATVFADRMVAATGSASAAAQDRRASQTPLETASSLSHAFSRAASQSAELLSPEDPFAAALKKFAAAEEKMGNFRLVQDQEATAKFYQPFLNSLNVTIADANVSFL